MDIRIADEATQIKEMIDRALLRVNTCIPGVIDSFDPATQTVSVIPAIKMRVNIDDETSFIDLPKIINAPLIFPFAIQAGFALTLPVQKGDACIILFSQRAIDNWHDKGGIQPPEDGVSTRHHDLTDALVMLAAPPVPNALSGWNEDGIEIRNAAGTSKVTILNDSVEVESAAVNVKALEATFDVPLSTFLGSIVVQGLVTCASLATLSAGTPSTMAGDLDVTGTLKQDGVDVGKDHTHSQPNDSNGDTEAETNGVTP